MNYRFLSRIIIFFSAIYLLFSAVFICSNTAKAQASDEEYGRIITQDTIFYEDEDCLVPLFCLPYTYYVKIISKHGDVTHVSAYGEGSIATIDGYVKSDKIFYDGLTVENPSPVIFITTSDTTPLYSDANGTNTLQFLFKGRKLAYYGSFINEKNEVLFFVGYNGKLGYVSENEIIPFSLPDHPNPLTFLTPDEEEQPETTTNGEVTLSLKIVVISCVAIAGILALVFVFGKKKKPTSRVGYYGENDFE